MGERGQDSAIGLVGGSLEARVEHSKVPPLDLEGVLAPIRRPGDAEALKAFLGHHPLHIEIGFGRPHHLCDLGAQRPGAHVLGFEIKRRWCRDAARRSMRLGLDNVRVIEGDARAYIERFVEDASVDAYHVLFPDPWWKKRHHKRRLFRADFVAELHRTLVAGGDLVVKTDVPAYADLIDEELHAHPGFELVGTSGDDPELGVLPRSHREKKCAEFAIPVFQFRFKTLEATP